MSSKIDEQNEKGNTLKKYIDIFWLIAVFISLIVYTVWRLFFTLPTPSTYGWIATICGVLLIVAEITSLYEGTEHIVRLRDRNMPKLPLIPYERYPDVDVFIATHNEEAELLYKTVNGCKHMDYPDKSKVHIYICDDNNREEVAKLAADMGVGYFGLSGNKLAKAGNLNNAIRQTKSPWIVTFDADMIPMHNFLMEMVPYTFLPEVKENSDGSWSDREEDEIEEGYKIGFIQSPQSFYNPDLFQYNFYSESRIPNEQDYFFKEINVGRNKANAPIYAGSNTIISRKALEEVGGIATGTITEDFETGINIQSRGYSCYAINKSLAHGLAPTDISSLITQRVRWGRGCISSLRKIKLLRHPKLSFNAKLSYFACKMYWWSFIRRLIYILAPIIFVLFSIPSIVTDLNGLLFIWLPTYLIHTYAISRMSGRIRNSRWSNIIDTVLFPHLIIPIMMETFYIKMEKFHVTKKVRETITGNSLELAIPHIVLLFFDIIALISVIFEFWNTRNLGSVVIIYWLFLSAINLLMAILFMSGRRNRRLNDRFNIRVPATLYFGNHKLNINTINLSDTGMSLELPLDSPLPERKESIRVYLERERYKAEVKGICIRVEKKEEFAECGMLIQDMEGEVKSNYYQILYDKKHDFADEISESVNMLDDLFLNIRKRISDEK